jgi:hypothetical protein
VFKLAGILHQVIATGPYTSNSFCLIFVPGLKCFCALQLIEWKAPAGSLRLNSETETAGRTSEGSLSSEELFSEDF